MHLARTTCRDNGRNLVLEKFLQVLSQPRSVERQIRIKRSGGESNYASKLGAELFWSHLLPHSD